VHWAVIVLVVASASPGTAQSAPTSCPADRPVDEIIAEVQKQQSKKANRNKDPFPSTGCIFGWCREAKTPPTLPQPAQNPESQAPRQEPPRTPGESTSKSEVERCNERMELALQAAHNVDVGDTQSEEKNYRAALSRYQEASEQKPGDAAILVRLGRAHEKLKQTAEAIEQYTAAEKLGAPEKWVAEARRALARLNAK
jgi:tetratricopeptide (TPR) repeat protein